MKRVGNLFAQVCTFENFLHAAHRARRGKTTKPQPAQFYFRLEPEILGLLRELESATYQPRPYHTFYVYDPKRRRISAAHFRDRVVHHAICRVLNPLFERLFIFDSYACREEKGTHRAVRRAQSFAKHSRFFFKCDVEHFFDTVAHDRLKALLRRKIKDPLLLALLDTIIDAPVPGAASGKGLAIGNLTSQYFANFYLTPLDNFLKQEVRVRRYLRYMDDFVLFHESKQFLHDARYEITEFLGQRLGLRLNEGASYVGRVEDGLPFLGVRIYPRLLRMKHRNWIRFARKMRDLARAADSGLDWDDPLLRSAQSLMAHACSANTVQLRRSFFGALTLRNCYGEPEGGTDGGGSCGAGDFRHPPGPESAVVPPMAERPRG